jgi:hypothetical protein
MNTNIGNIYTKPALGLTEKTLAVSTAAAGVSFDISDWPPEAYSVVDIQVQGAAVRVRFDGTAPDTNTGFILPDGFSASWPSARVSAAKWIRDASTDAVVRAAPSSH